MLRTNVAKIKELDLEDLRRPFTDVDWKKVRDAQVRSARDAVESVKHMRRDPAAERRNGVILAALAAVIGAALMYLFDPGNGSSRRASARVLLTRWYQSGRGQLDRAWRPPQTERPAFDMTQHARSNGDPTNVHDAPPRDVTVAP